MKAYAASKGVPVYMGYNKNVTPYVQKVGGGGGGVVVSIYPSYPYPWPRPCPCPWQAIEFERKTPGASTTFVHLNAYKTEELGECFERNAEGMLKNMAIHELAVLATYYGLPPTQRQPQAPSPEPQAPKPQAPSPKPQALSPQALSPSPPSPEPCARASSTGPPPPGLPLQA